MQIRWILLLCATARLAVAGDQALDLAPPNTKAMFGIRVSQLTHSALFQTVAEQKSALVEEWSKLEALVGFDPLRDIDEVVIAAPDDDHKSQGLVILRGRFNEEKMAAGAARYRGVPMIGGGGNTSVIALLDGETAIAGDRPVVRAAIDRRGNASVLPPALAARVQVLREHFDVWGYGETTGALAPTSVGKEWDSLDRFEFGALLSDGFELAAELHSRRPQDAEKLAASIGSITALMGAAGPKAPKTKLEVKDGSVRFSVAIAAEDLKRMIAERKSAGWESTTLANGAPVKSGPPVIIGMEKSGEQPVKSAPPAITGGDAASAPVGAKPSETTTFKLPGKK